MGDDGTDATRARRDNDFTREIAASVAKPLWPHVPVDRASHRFTRCGGAHPPQRRRRDSITRRPYCNAVVVVPHSCVREGKKGDVLTSSRVTKRAGSDRGADPARPGRPARFSHHCWPR